MNIPKVSIIVPTYNEGKNIGPLLENIMRSMSKVAHEIIVVDDSSVDETREVVRKYMETYSFIKLLERPRKMGLGSAYKDGFTMSIGKIIVTMDADLSHNPIYLLNMVRKLVEEKYDVILGSRYIQGGVIEGWPISRKITSRVANTVARLVLDIPVKDATTGYRVYTREAFDFVRRRSTCHHYDFQIESLYILVKNGFKIGEYPIKFVNRKLGRSKLNIKEIYSFLLTILKLRARR